MKTLLVLALGLLASVATAAPALVFDTTPGGAGGTLTYDGLGGPVVGTGIVFVDISGLGTPLQDGTTLDCVACTLDFTTGANLQEGPAQLWQWDGGGTFVLTGTVPSIGINAPTALLAGSFTATANTPSLAANATAGLFLGAGLDTKDPVLAAFFGLSSDNWIFGNTEIALGTFVLDPATNGFRAIPNQADLVNAQVPEPATLLLLGTGLLGLAGWRRHGG